MCISCPSFTSMGHYQAMADRQLILALKRTFLLDHFSEVLFPTRGVCRLSQNHRFRIDNWPCLYCICYSSIKNQLPSVSSENKTFTFASVEHACSFDLCWQVRYEYRLALYIKLINSLVSGLIPLFCHLK